jgi:hypothetical protein
MYAGEIDIVALKSRGSANEYPLFLRLLRLFAAMNLAGVAPRLRGACLSKENARRSQSGSAGIVLPQLPNIIIRSLREA